MEKRRTKRNRKWERASSFHLKTQWCSENEGAHWPTHPHLSPTVLKVRLVFPPRPCDTAEWLDLESTSVLDPGSLLPSSVALSNVFSLFEFQFL